MSGDHVIAGPHIDVSFRTNATVAEAEALWLTLEAAARPSFFLSWRWVGCWLRQTGLTPHLLLGYADGKLIGLALLQLGAKPTLPYLRNRFLTSSGSAAFDSVFVEYNGFLSAPADSDRVGIAFRDFMLHGDAACDWTGLHLPAVSDAMRALWTDGNCVVRSEVSRSAPFIDLVALRKAGKPYLDSRSSNCRQQIRRSMRLFQADGELELDVASSLVEAHAIFDELKMLHQQSWQARGKPGCFAVPFFERFHRALLEEAWSAGQIDLLRLRAGFKVVGCLYNFMHDGNAYAYQSGFAYEDDARLKPGLVAHALAAERYRNAGFERYRLLAGESRYKTSLATGADTMHWLVVRRRGMRVAAGEWAEKTIRRLGS